MWHPLIVSSYFFVFLSEFIIIKTAETIPIITNPNTITIIIVPLSQEKSVVSFMFNCILSFAKYKLVSY